jgi:polysaccharide deacetylase family protein (PEP-CTERM system associated)
MLNALTIDVEDYFQVSAFEQCVSRDCWDNYALRVEDNTKRILDILDEFQVRATFFVLGWIAERCTSLAREIVQKGHEVASHGYGHQRIYNQSREEFRNDIRRSKSILENLTGMTVLGYRAPSYSLSMDTLWAYDELLEAGYQYDSSVFPIRHDLYGIPNWPRFPFFVEKGLDGQWQPVMEQHSEYSEQDFASNGSRSQVKAIRSRMTEIPITTLSIAGKNFPIAGGGYFRLFPYPLTKWGLQRINHSERRPFVFYIHPWEIDPDQPRFRGACVKSRFRHYLNLQKTETRFRHLLADFRFAPICESSLSTAEAIHEADTRNCLRPGVGRYAGISLTR